VEVSQGGRVLHAQSYGLLRPNVSMKLSGRWVGRVDLEVGAVTVRVQDG